MKTETNPTTNAHLMSTCPAVCRDYFCKQQVKQGPNGRWFITMGHAGFNSPANNADGFKTRGIAVRVWAKYHAKAAPHCAHGMTAKGPDCTPACGWPLTGAAWKAAYDMDVHHAVALMEDAKRSRPARMAKAVSAQKVNQANRQKDNGTGGRFGTLNPCYACKKSAGENYNSHRLTDCGWADLALVLCDRCALATGDMIDTVNFIDYAEKMGGMTKEEAARMRAQEIKERDAMTAIEKAKIVADFIPNKIYADAVRELIAIAEKAKGAI